MFKQVGPIVTIITASGGPGLSTCVIDDGLVARGARQMTCVDEQGPSPYGDGWLAPLAQESVGVADIAGSRMDSARLQGMK
jgi:hypothetical protein